MVSARGCSCWVTEVVGDTEVHPPLCRALLVSPLTIRDPAVKAVEALGPLIADQNPQHGIRESLNCHAVPCITDQHPADSVIPPVGVDVDRKDFPSTGSIRIATWPSGGKPTNDMPSTATVVSGATGLTSPKV